MISPEESCLSPGAYGAFAISEVFLCRTKVPGGELCLVSISGMDEEAEWESGLDP